MDEEDGRNFEDEISGNGTDPQVVAPVSINFEVVCTIDSTHPGKPVCKLKYKPQGESTVESTIEESDEKDSADSVDEEKAEKKKKTQHHLKKSKSDKGEDDDDTDSDDDEDDDDEGDENPVLRCVAESYDRN